LWKGSCFVALDQWKVVGINRIAGDVVHCPDFLCRDGRDRRQQILPRTPFVVDAIVNDSLWNLIVRTLGVI
jgi:hypothetical protein